MLNSLICVFQSNSKGAMVSLLEINKHNTVLFSGDSLGFIYLWNVDGYASDGREYEPPEGNTCYIVWSVYSVE